MTEEQSIRLEQKIDKYFGLMMDEMQGMKDKMATKEDLQDFREEVRAEFAGFKSRIGGIDNRIDNEMAERKDLEHRVRVVVPNLPLAPERV
jgi:hypothetical protein